MKKSQLLNIVCALTLFASISSTNAAIVAGNDTTITNTDKSYAQTFEASPLLFTDAAPVLNLPGESGHTQPDFHISLWLLLIVAFVFGTLSEIYHRRSGN